MPRTDDANSNLTVEAISVDGDWTSVTFSRPDAELDDDQVRATGSVRATEFGVVDGNLSKYLKIIFANRARYVRANECSRIFGASFL